jgi:predicted nucleic acid-binding protein
LIVLDASATLELLLRTHRGDRVAAWISPASQTLHAPHLLDLEVTQVLRRYTSAGDIEPERAREALEDLMALGIHRYAHEPMLQRIWQLRTNLTAYDAAYVALAEALGATLVTSDARLAGAPGHAARVELLR